MKSICTLPDGATLSVQFADTGRAFRHGDALELDAQAAPGLTWRDALGAHVAHFDAPAAEQGEVQAADDAVQE